MVAKLQAWEELPSFPILNFWSRLYRQTLARFETLLNVGVYAFYINILIIQVWLHILR